MIFVTHAWADDVFQRMSFASQSRFHHASCLNLFVFLSAVSHDGEVEKIPRIIWTVVHFPECLFDVSRISIGRQPIVLSGLRKTRAGAHGNPLVRVVGPQVPHTSSSHGEAHQDNAIRIDGVLTLHLVDHFKDIHLARRFEPHAMSSKWVNHQRVVDSQSPGALHPLVDEMKVGCLVTPAMEPDK